MGNAAESRKAEAARPALRPSVPLDDLAARQGVHPPEDLDALAARWPADDDPDALDAFVLSQRAARRRIPRGSP
jgi:hypothetical protein